MDIWPTVHAERKALAADTCGATMTKTGQNRRCAAAGRCATCSPT